MANKPKQSGKKPRDWEEMRDLLTPWLKNMNEWGRRVRQDIVRLEQAAGLPPGDPGDPPPPPWGDG